MKEDNIKKITDQYMETKDHSRIRLRISRPNINYKKAFMKVLLYLFGILVFSFIVSNLSIGSYSNSFGKFIFVFLLLGVAVLVVKMKSILIWLIKVYQSKAKIQTRLKCCFEPSCSDYTILALEKYGLICGVIKSLKRFKRCHPPGGVDYP